ncbi:MAG: aminopeptidase [Clostridiales bacterium]|jgi:aspartyl aminopeptidase|nr:aminopeptidase [Clostridiales bacterium]
MFCQEKSAYLKVEKSETERAKVFCDGYRDFLNHVKTEREAAIFCVEYAKSHGFTEFREGSDYNPGDRVCFINRGKSLSLAVIGQENPSNGVNIVAAHIDSPRIDLKQNPVYQDSDLVMLKTHYYGGIKKYQWTTIPLALHGDVVTQSGVVHVNIGENSGDPVFVISDLLPHLAREQMAKKGSEIIKGEGLNILFGSEQQDDDDDKDGVKTNILRILKEKYGIVEEDFISAELSAVPAFQAADVGLDCSLLGGYGQDDRVCAYTALEAIVNLKSPNKTAFLFLADKEEVGSMGNTGMKSTFFAGTVSRLFPDLSLHGILSASACLSADVCAAFDPNYKSVQEKTNAPQLNHGLTITKYTGSGGKSGSSDANAEFVGKIRQIFNASGVAWQIGELGKVDQGGGGTVAQFLANLNIDVLDCGVPVLSMHSPYEVTGKLDVYMAFKGYNAFFEQG